MGKMVKQLYVGAFISTNEPFNREKVEQFNDIVSEDDFYEKFEEKFIFPYEGLEYVGILLPNGDYCVEIDDDAELVINETYLKNANLNEKAERLRVDYKEVIDYLNNLYDGEVFVDSGIVMYWDEIA